MLIERTKVFDYTYINHGLKFAQLMAAVHKYGLGQHPEIVEMNKVHMARIQQKQKEMQDRFSLSDQDLYELEEEIKTWGNLNSRNKGDGYMLLKDFLNIQTTAIKYGLRWHNKHFNAHLEKRR